MFISLFWHGPGQKISLKATKSSHFWFVNKSFQFISLIVDKEGNWEKVPKKESRVLENASVNTGYFEDLKLTIIFLTNLKKSCSFQEAFSSDLASLWPLKSHLYRGVSVSLNSRDAARRQ